jgi:hypothetical protein
MTRALLQVQSVFSCFTQKMSYTRAATTGLSDTDDYEKPVAVTSDILSLPSPSTRKTPLKIREKCAIIHWGR